MDTLHPPAEVVIGSGLVRDLLAEQHPDLAGEALALADEGWDNVTWRLGASLAVRVPRREVAVGLLRNEQRWLPVLAPRLDIPIPAPVRVGEPGTRFPWPWSVIPWIEGDTADLQPLAEGQGERLARILRALHRPAPPDAPTNPFRGMPLAQRAEFVDRRLDVFAANRTGESAPAGGLRALWDDGTAARVSSDVVWLHGDLHARNVVVRGGALAGIIDWGDMCAGDAATDLACAWLLLESERERARFWDAYGPADGTLERARAWGVLFAVAMATSGEPRQEVIGRSVVARLVRTTAGPPR